MSMSPQPDDGHEFVVAPELAEVAERLGVPLHAGDRVRFEVIDGDGVTGRTNEPRAVAAPWVKSIKTDEGHLGARAREIMRAEFSPSVIIIDTGPIVAASSAKDPDSRALAGGPRLAPRATSHLTRSVVTRGLLLPLATRATAAARISVLAFTRRRDLPVHRPHWQGHRTLRRSDRSIRRPASWRC